MKNLFLLLAILFSAPVFAQDYDDEEVVEEEDNGVVDGIVAKQHIKSKRHMQPAYVREANVLWSKTIWRMIDLREKQNQYLYYPTNNVDDRRSLVRVLLDGIQNGDIDAYGTSSDNEFEVKMSFKDVCDKFAPGEEEISVDSVVQTDPETGEEVVKFMVDKSSFASEEIKKFLVKEVWYFDRKYSMMRVRIIGLCPIREKKNAEGNRIDNITTFWVYYPQAAQILSEQEAYTYGNDAQRQSLYDCLEQRKFGSYIYRESNVYNNRVIQDYSQGMSQNIEAENIQNNIFQKEHDMWEY